MRIAVREVQGHEVESLLHFSEQMYGQGSYQSLKRYLQWLYEQNPFSRGIEDCIIATEQEAIVGCVHRMRLPCSTGAGTTTLASLQNHVVSPRFRGGAGIMLLQRAVKGEAVTFSPGVHGRLSEAYRRLGYSEIASYWFQHLLSPIRAAAQIGLRRISRDRLPSTDLLMSNRLRANTGSRAIEVTATPDADQLHRLAMMMQAQSAQEAAPHVPWTAELLNWRYFSPDGPRHLLVEDKRHGASAILSYGIRSRMNVARLLEFEPGQAEGFMDDVIGVARRIGAAVALAYSTRTHFKNQLLSTGWRLRDDPPSSFTRGTAQLSVSAAAGDFGFEAFSTRLQA